MEQLQGFPSDLIPKYKKLEDDNYYLQYCRAAYSNRSTSNTWNGLLNTERILANRKLGRGFTDVDNFKKLNPSLVNFAASTISYDVKSPIHNFRNNIVGAIVNQPIRIDVQSGVLNASSEYDKEYQRRLNLFALQAQAAQIKQQTGVDINDIIPEKDKVLSKDELEVQMVDWRDATCIVLEDAINFIESRNNSDFINEKVAEDLVEQGFGVTRVSFDANMDIKREWVDVVNFISSWSNDGEFKKIRYAGHVEFIEIPTLIALGVFKDDEEAKKFVQTYTTSSNIIEVNGFTANPSQYQNRENDWKSAKFPVLHLEWLSVDNIEKEKFKTTKGATIIKDRKQNKRKGHIEFISKKEQNIYKCSWIVGSNKVFNTGLAKNQLLEEANGENKQLNYTIYMTNMFQMQSMSIIDMLKDLHEKYCLAVIRTQAIIAKIAPPLVAYDVSSLNSVMAGMGGWVKTPKDVMQIAEATGTVYMASVRQGGKVNAAKPVYEIPTSIENKINPLLAYLDYVTRQMETVTGVPLSTIGSVDNDALVGIEKMKAINRNNSLRYINTAYKQILERTAEKEAQMIVDSIQFGYKKVEDFEVSLGKLNVTPLDVKKRLLLRDHNIKVKALPDAMELEKINLYIDRSLQAQIIKPSDAMYVEQIAKQNPDKVRMYLQMKENQYVRQQQESAQMASKAQAEAQAEGAARIEAAKQQTEQLKMQLEIMQMQQKATIDAKQSQIDFMEELRLQQEKLQGELEKIRVATEMAAKANQLNDGGSMKNTTLPSASGVRQPKTPEGVGN